MSIPYKADIRLSSNNRSCKYVAAARVGLSAGERLERYAHPHYVFRHSPAAVYLADVETLLPWQLKPRELGTF